MIKSNFSIYREEIPQSNLSSERYNGTSLSVCKVVKDTTREGFSVIPELGGRLHELYLSNGKKVHQVLRRYNPFSIESRDDLFTNAKMCPYAGRVKSGKYIFNGREYQLPINYPEEGNSSHGLIFDKPFKVVDMKSDENFAEIALDYEYRKENEGYPFDFDIRIIHRLEKGKGYSSLTSIINLSDTEIPIADGWHPYFDLNTNIDNLKLQFDSYEMIITDENKMPSSKKRYDEFKTLKKIGNTFFDNCFTIVPEKGVFNTFLFNEKENFHLKIWQESGKDKYNYLVIYTPPDRKTIAIEPMTSNINAFNNGEGLIILKPQESFEVSFGIATV
ncbi:aldose 1-epimerase [Melioribacter sp. OK-6-Me]|uniref:aldose 1-epimerase n=1 Tax=unclassified Melioribacter TaxID=2627329 RepID=UPI003EDAFCD3